MGVVWGELGLMSSLTCAGSLTWNKMGESGIGSPANCNTRRWLSMSVGQVVTVYMSSSSMIWHNISNLGVISKALSFPFPALEQSTFTTVSSHTFT